ncbi:MAG: hypothetical protein ACKOAH_08985, partial [Pirellula sp.]
SFAQQSQLASLQNQRLQLAGELDRLRGEVQAQVDQRWLVPKPLTVGAQSPVPLIIEADQSIRAIADRPATDQYEVRLEIPAGRYRYLKLDALMAKANPNDAAPRLGLNASDPNFVINELAVYLKSPSDQTKLAMQSVKASFEQNGWPLKGAVDEDPKTGWAVSPKQQQSHWGVFEFTKVLEITEPTELRVSADNRS